MERERETTVSPPTVLSRPDSELSADQKRQNYYTRARTEYRGKQRARFATHLVLRSPRDHRQLAEATQRAERLTTEAERRQRRQVGELGELRGVVLAAERREVVGRNAASVVRDLDRSETGVLQADVDRRGATSTR